MGKLINTKPIIIYKLRNKKTGLFSGNGSTPNWSSVGKAWSSRGAIKNHLKLKYKKVSKIPDDFEVCECVSHVVEFFSAKDLWDPLDQI